MRDIRRQQNELRRRHQTMKKHLQDYRKQASQALIRLRDHAYGQERQQPPLESGGL